MKSGILSSRPATEVARNFAIDGLELCYRDHRYFPPGQGSELRGLMTEMLEQIRTVLDEPSPHGGKRRLFGARVFSSINECVDMGLDVEQWIGRGTIDYLAPQDIMFADFSVDYEEFAALTRASECMLYPGLLPWTSTGARRRVNQEPISQDTRRALAKPYTPPAPTVSPSTTTPSTCTEESTGATPTSPSIPWPSTTPAI